MKPIQKKKVKSTVEYRKWFSGLTDDIAKTAVAARIGRVQNGLYGDVEPAREGVSELRIDHGQGYRVYFTESQDVIVLLLLGGNKTSQKRDIKAAQKMLKQMKQEQAKKRVDEKKAAKTKPAPQAAPKSKR